MRLSLLADAVLVLHALLADAVLVLHALFIVFVVAGGFTLLWRLAMAWLHLPAAAWGVWVSWSGSTCPLTPLERSLRMSAGQGAYERGFIEHYLGAAIYPQGLTPTAHIMLGAAVLAINVAVYAVVAVRAARRRRMA